MLLQNPLTNLNKCLACDSVKLEPLLDLGKQPLANSFRSSKEEKLDRYPLAVNHCLDCHHVQLTDIVHPDLMFKRPEGYQYVSGTSKTMHQYCHWFAVWADEYYGLQFGTKATRVLDIGCNDGTQLDYFKLIDYKTYGVDPADNLYELSSKNHLVHLGYFDDSYQSSDTLDILVAQNVFAHNYDPSAFLQKAKDMMYNESLLFIQTSQADMILHNEFDTIYHEHISFFCINSMKRLVERNGLYLVEVIKSPLHGNSFIFVVARENVRPYNVINLIEMERMSGLHNPNTYYNYRENVQKVLQNLSTTLKFYKHTKNFCIVGYGAAAKGMTLLNAGMYTEFNMIIDDSPLKQNKWTPGLDIPIVPNTVLTAFSPEDKILFVPLAWNFYEEISTKIKSIRNNPNDRFCRYFPTVSVNQ